MSVSENKGRTALTEWQALEEFKGEFTLLGVRLRTGRTHQIRVHLSHMGHAIVGDGVYGRGRNWWKRHPLYRAGKLPRIDRQMLHAELLGFVHPDTGDYVEFSTNLPDDMKHLLDALRGLA
jgi:23S rRNA pseudouridine1911/1915/1917 synthase